MKGATFIKSLLPPNYNADADVFNVLIGAIGAMFDSADPEQINLKSAFSVTTAMGEDLDEQGKNWGEERRYNESDDSFRQRILSLLPLYANGPNVTGIKEVIKPFTGISPIIFEYGPDAFVMGESPLGDAGFCEITDVFTFEIHVQNINNAQYSHLDLEYAVNAAKPAESTAIVYHNGVDTSTAAEAANAVISIV